MQALCQLTDGTYEVRRGDQTDIIEKEASEIVLNDSSRFKLVKSKTGYGERYFLECECDQRVKRIYFVDDKWACRHCHNLTYKVRNLTKAQLELYKVNARIDALTRQADNLKGKHSKTRLWLIRELEQAGADYTRIMDEREKRIHDRIMRWFR